MGQGTSGSPALGVRELPLTDPALPAGLGAALGFPRPSPTPPLSAPAPGSGCAETPTLLNTQAGEAQFPNKAGYKVGNSLLNKNTLPISFLSCPRFTMTVTSAHGQAACKCTLSSNRRPPPLGVRGQDGVRDFRLLESRAWWAFSSTRAGEAGAGRLRRPAGGGQAGGSAGPSASQTDCRAHLRPPPPPRHCPFSCQDSQALGSPSPSTLSPCPG